MKANHIVFPGKSTYFENQRSIHLGVVAKISQLDMSAAVEEAKSKSAVDLGGDAR